MGADIKAKSWSEVEMQFRTTLELGELVQFIAAARAAGFADTDKVSVVTDPLSGGNLGGELWPIPGTHWR